MQSSRLQGKWRPNPSGVIGPLLVTAGLYACRSGVAAADPAQDTREATAKVAAAELSNKDPDSIDLGAIADFGATPDCTDVEWAQMNEWMETFMDVDAGAAGPRAARELLHSGRKAIPVVINYMKNLDLTTEWGLRAGDICQRTLQRLFGGKSFGWRYPREEDYVWFNKKVVQDWAKTWQKASKDIEFWIELVELDTKDPEEAQRLRRLYGEGV